MEITQLSKPHLLIIAHGSRSSKWNHSIEELITAIQELNEKKQKPFSDVSSCYLEHAQPSVPVALTSLVQTGHSVIALPFFLAPGVHVKQDVPDLVMRDRKIISQEEEYIHVRVQHANVHLIPHFAELDFLAQNAIHRFGMVSEGSNMGLILVYYGSKRYPEKWDNLTKEVEIKIKQLHNTIQIRSVYAGDFVDFSPQPLTDAIIGLHEQGNRIVILPMLIAVGVIQTDVIPKAIEYSNLQNEIIYKQDSILPDKLVAEQIWNYARKFTSKTALSS